MNWGAMQCGAMRTTAPVHAIGAPASRNRRVVRKQKPVTTLATDMADLSKQQSPLVRWQAIMAKDNA
ncbi:MAG: hypothetical protein RJB02_764 [Pseudomonadota bacterium]